MSDQAIQNAVRSREECLAQIAVAEKQIAEWKAKAERAERFIKDWEEFSGMSAPASEAAAPSTVSPPAKPKNPRKEDVAEAVRSIIIERNTPVPAPRLLTLLAEQGIVLHGQDRAAVLQTMLWRMRHRVVNLAGLGYWPQEAPYPRGGYDPSKVAPPDADPADDDDSDEEAKALI